MGIEISTKQVFEALEDASKEYIIYKKLQEIIDTTELCNIQDNYDRDMNYPLTLVLRG
jgi:hypothetical protein